MGLNGFDPACPEINGKTAIYLSVPFYLLLQSVGCSDDFSHFHFGWPSSPSQAPCLSSAHKHGQREGDNKPFSSNAFPACPGQGAGSSPQAGAQVLEPPQLLPLGCRCQLQHGQQPRCSSLRSPRTMCRVFEVPECDPTAGHGIKPPSWIIFTVPFLLAPALRDSTNPAPCCITALSLLSTEIISLWLICLLGCFPLGF